MSTKKRSLHSSLYEDSKNQIQLLERWLVFHFLLVLRLLLIYQALGILFRSILLFPFVEGVLKICLKSVITLSVDVWILQV